MRLPNVSAIVGESSHFTICAALCMSCIFGGHFLVPIMFPPLAAPVSGLDILWFACKATTFFLVIWVTTASIIVMMQWHPRHKDPLQ